MYTDILRGITGIHVFPVISLLLFSGVFALVLVYVCRADRHALARHAALPLDDAPASERKRPSRPNAEGRI